MIDETMQARRDDESTNERAVSPVIGVILMVAITVILAAVIAAFVLDLGPGDPDPTGAVSVSGDVGGIVEVELQSLDESGDAVVVVNNSSHIVAYENGGDDVALTTTGQTEEFEVYDGYTVQAVAVDDPNELEPDVDVEQQTDANAILENF